jgi:hypothetical protein
MTWLVQYRDAATDRLARYPSPEEAIRAACGLLDTAAISLAGAAFAVGTLISERPPHRTGRAQFGHPAPTLGV